MPATPATSVELERVGRYQKQEQLGAGGMGTVYRGWDPVLRRAVALKRIRPERALRADARARFRREAQATARLSHPAIAQVYDVVEAGGTLWIVLELIDGEPLHRLERHGDAALTERIGWLRQIAEGLGAAHERGILHRDLKRENVMLTRGGHAKVLDFGLAQPLAAFARPDAKSSVSLSGIGTTAEERLVGTPRAMSPEQILGEPLDARSDLFAFGVLAYECLAGVSPFSGRQSTETMMRVVMHHERDLDELMPEVPRELSRLVSRLLSKEPAGRPRDAGEVVTLLGAVIERLESARDDAARDATSDEPADGTTLEGTIPDSTTLAEGTLPATPRDPSGDVPDSASRRSRSATGPLLGVLLLTLLGVGLFDSRGVVAGDDPPRGDAGFPGATAPDVISPAHFDHLMTLRGRLRAAHTLDSLNELERDLQALEREAPELVEAPLLRLRVLRRLFAHSREPELLERAFGVAARARALAPRSALPVLAETEVALDGHHLKRAEQLLTELEHLGADRPHLDTLRAWWLRLAGHPRDAVDLLRRQALHRTSPEWLYELAHLEVSLGEHDAARRHLEQLLDSEPKHAPARRLLAQAELLGGDLERAATLYRELLTEGTDVVSLSNLALVELLRGRAEEALPLAQRAVDAAPRNAALRLNLADVLRALGRHDDAAAHDLEVLAATDADPARDGWQRWSVRAQALAHLGRVGEARAALGRARGSTGGEELAVEAAAVLAAVGDLEAAKSELRQAIDQGLSPVWLRLPAFQALEARLDDTPLDEAAQRVDLSNRSGS